MGPAKQKKSIFSKIEIKKQLPAIVYSVLRVTFKLEINSSSCHKSNKQSHLE